MTARERPHLERLAEAHGIELRYHDIRGREHVATDEVLVALLERLGCPAGDGASYEDLLGARKDVLAERLLPPVTVSWDGGGGLVLRVTRSEAQNRADVTLVTEDGRQSRFFAPLAEASVVGRMDSSSREYVDVEIPLPVKLAFGYHRVVVELGVRRAEGALWVAPTRAPGEGREPGFGLFAPTYALRSERNGGIGDFHDLGDLAAWVGAQGGSTVATLPLLPTFVDGLYDPSPYAPISRLFWNELFLAIDDLPDLERAPKARALLENAEYRATLGDLRESAYVDYAAVVMHKRRLLSILCDAAFADETERARLERRLRETPRLEDYARFRATVERQKRPFSQWPERMRERIQDEDFDGSSFRYHAFCQIRAEDQMKALAARAKKAGVGLYMDLPLGAHSGGYDAFRFGAQMLAGCSTGAPPDALFEGGQSWGFAPPHPERASAAEHSYFVLSLRHQMSAAEILRIDHVMGLHRLFCIPPGYGAADGVYVRQPDDELYAALLIEAVRAGTRLVGEDLGTVPDEVRARMARHGIGRLYVLQYEPVPEPGRSLAVPVGAVASINTHDMPTFLGYLRGSDLETQKELGLLDDAGVLRERAARSDARDRIERYLESRDLLERPPRDEELLTAELRSLAGSRASIALVSADDLLGETEPQNVPGTGPERPNFGRKLRATLETITTSPEIHRLLSALRRTPPTDRTSERPSGIRSRPCARLTDLDLHLFNEGTHREIYARFGAHPGVMDGAPGTYFSVWAPNAESVHVIGDFNEWQATDAPLYLRGRSGVWEGFVPGVGQGDLYKLYVVSKSGHGTEKADPLAVRAEAPPRTASVVWSPEHRWGDEAWMSSRGPRNALDAPCSIYEVHLGSFARAADGSLLGYRELAERLSDHVKRLGFTHVELLPVMEHPFYGSWGYQLTGYFAATARYGSPEDLMAFVDHLHQDGIGVLFDWVPSHFPTDAHGLGYFDGTHLYEHADPRRGFHPDWKSYIFNYGRCEVRSLLTSSALYWLEKFHGDGLRVDGVASMLYLDYSRADGQWIPNEFGGRENLDAISFLRWLNESVYGRFPDVSMTAEESTAWPMVSRPTYLGGLGFGSKWDLGWMHDTLDYFSKDPIHRRYHHDRLTFRGMYAWHENFVLPLSHDEVVHGKGSLLGKMPGDDFQKFANLRLLFAYQYACPGHKLLFMGGELGTRNEWSHESPLELSLLDSPPHAGVARLVSALNAVYRSEPALYELDKRPEGFAWVDIRNAEESVLAFERRARDGSRVLAVFNFTPVVRRGYRVGVTTEGFWKEILNSNAAEFGGTGEGNFGGRKADPVGAHGRRYSIEITLPPLAAVYFRSP
ncbi:MAG TPA: 1,4-alpha-glucan branching protein GlgB [Polyangiaceae bacterium]|nr:1,4-alpha-glucan branching protein GlgB [Polyangiaceae bacterium]